MIDNPAFAVEILNRILRNTQEGTILLKSILDEKGRVTDFEYLLINTAALNILNKKEEEVVGHRMLELFPGVKPAGLFQQYVKVVETGENIQEETFYDFDGLNVWFRIKVSKVQDGLLINFTDISDLKHALLENKRSQKLYSILIKCLPGVEMALIDRDSKLIICEGSPLKAIIGDQKVEKGQDLHHIVHKEEADLLLPLVKAAFKGDSQRRELEWEDKLFRLSFVPIREEWGSISHVLVLSEDISIFRNSQNDLRNKIYALESANESLEQFAYVASHDLQEPLRKIRAFGDRLSTKYAEQLEGSGKDYIERMQNAAARMQVLINDLLKYSRVGRFKEPFQAINLAELIRDITNDLETTIADTEAKIVIKELPVLEAEPLQLRQLFQNLISNALKFRQPEVSPEVIVQCEEPSAAELEELANYQSTRNYYKIVVTDNGIGFDEKYLDRIFNIFQRLHGRSEYKGTGIGLAICRKIAENHGGTISANSTPGKGSSFYVILPEHQNVEL